MFCDGQCYDDGYTKMNHKQMPPYVPKGHDLESKTLSMDLVHWDGTMELDGHSLYGAMHSQAVHKCDIFVTPARDTLLMSKSTFAGSGKYGGRWFSENNSTYEYMSQSIIDVMMSNMFGIPFAGADICGYNSNATAELCTRWHFVGAFYPFSRNHNSDGTLAQEPYEFKNQTYAKTNQSYMVHMRDAINTKYSLLQYYFSQMNSLQKRGGTFLKPLWFRFPDDYNAFYNMTNNFMIGDALKVSIQTGSNDDETWYYMPKYNFSIETPVTQWCNLFNPSKGCIEGGKSYKFPSLIHHFDVHILEGHIVPFQDARLSKILNSADLANNKTDLHIHPRCNLLKDGCSATGLVTGIVTFETMINLSREVNGTDFTMQFTNDLIGSNEHILKESSDILGSIYFYNVNQTMMNHAYSVKMCTYKNICHHYGETVAE